MPRQIKDGIKITSKFALAYELYFGMKIGDQDKLCALHVICGLCQSNLNGWKRGGGYLAIRRIQRDPQTYVDDYILLQYSGYFKI